jgi:hypothetical protein
MLRTFTRCSSKNDSSTRLSASHVPGGRLVYVVNMRLSNRSRRGKALATEPCFPSRNSSSRTVRRCVMAKGAWTCPATTSCILAPMSMRSYSLPTLHSHPQHQGLRRYHRTHDVHPGHDDAHCVHRAGSGKSSTALLQAKCMTSVTVVLPGVAHRVNTYLDVDSRMMLLCASWPKS